MTDFLIYIGRYSEQKMRHAIRKLKQNRRVQQLLLISQSLMLKYFFVKLI